MTDSSTLRTIIESATALVVAWVAYHQRAIKSDVSRIELSINSRMDKLLQTTRALAHAQGISDEKERAALADEKPKEP